MPELDGIEVLGRIRLKDEEMPVVLMSGFSNTGSSETVLSDPAALFIQKPFSALSLRQALSELLS